MDYQSTVLDLQLAKENIFTAGSLNMKEDNLLFKDSVIKLTLANGKPYLYEGQFKYFDNKVKPETDSITIYSYFKNDNNDLLPNSYVTVDIFRTFKNSVILDKNLIEMRADGYFLTISRQNKILQQPVSILSEDENKFIIKNIFQKDDMIVLDNVTNVINDEKISFVVQKS